MNEIEKVLSLFKTAEDWNSFVELSNMKDMMVRELKCRLLTEMRKIAVPKLSGVDWEYDANCDYISIVLHGHHTLKICIECIIAKTKCAKIENETSKTSLFFAFFFLLASGFVKCKLNAD